MALSLLSLSLSLSLTVLRPRTAAAAFARAACTPLGLLRTFFLVMPMGADLAGNHMTNMREDVNSNLCMYQYRCAPWGMSEIAAAKKLHHPKNAPLGTRVAPRSESTNSFTY